MSGSVNAVMRPLTIPSKFVPYLERHRIYELFHELATGLIIQKPSDQILYLKQNLNLASKKRDFPKIILFGEPHSKMILLAEILTKKIPLALISLTDLYKISPDIPEDDFSEQNIVENLIFILKKLAIDYSGWIFVGFPRNKNEARAIQKVGIIPTHVLEIVNSCRNPEGNELIENRENNLCELRRIYDNFLIKIETREKNINDLAETCATLIKNRKKHYGAPCTFRVALIGSRGSGCRSMAKNLAERFNVVHVDFSQILEQARLQENCLGKTLRIIEYKWGKLPKPETRIRVIEKYLLAPECIKRGWVLTGYPITVEDFKLLDLLPTPPNRIIIVNVDKKILRDRLSNRRYNRLTGSKNDFCSKNNVDNKFFVHPKDDKKVVENDIEEFERNVKSLINYIGESGTIIDGNGDEKNIQERVEACLIRSTPCAQPRILKRETKNEFIEFEPEDEPDPCIFDKIRQKESILSLF